MKFFDKIKPITPGQITILVSLCLLLIFASQGILVADYFRTTRDALIRESDVILKEAVRKELNIRHKAYKVMMHEDTMTVVPPSTHANTTKISHKDVKNKADNVLDIIDLVVNELVSKKVPLNIQALDSITAHVLQERGIKSGYSLNIQGIDSDKGVISTTTNSGISLFKITSSILYVDLAKKQAIRLILVNPFGLIVKRMGFMLAGSLLLSILCLLAFNYLMKIMARQKQLVAFKNEFLGTIAHELKRPVASLTFNLDSMMLPVIAGNPQKQEMLIHNSVAATSELNDTINMIVVLSKVEEGLMVLNRETIDLKKMMDELVLRFEHFSAKKVVIQIQYETDKIVVNADSGLLNQCFANLIDNAIKYSGNEVQINIRVRVVESWLVVSIKDNGFGIAEDKLPMIFEKYNRVHTENKKINGFGIGLNYVKSIVDLHHGHVEVSSMPGIGSEFSVFLPSKN